MIRVHNEMIVKNGMADTVVEEHYHVNNNGRRLFCRAD
jgi:hypothetical protein